MILSLAIIINLTAGIALIAGLAYAMSRTTQLTPHLATVESSAQPVASAQRRPRTRASHRPAAAVLAAARS